VRDFKLAAIAMLFVLFAAVGACAALVLGCTPAVDATAYGADETACVARERADMAKCRAEHDACKARIDACRAAVRMRYGLADGDRLGGGQADEQALAARYSGRFPGYPYVGFYSLWNEPNPERRRQLLLLRCSPNTNNRYPAK
jgi:hypothetical protein